MNMLLRRLAGLAVGVAGWLTRPTPIERSPQELRLLAGEIKRLRIYDYPNCPRSLKLRQTLHRLNLDIQYCDIRKCQVHRDNLLAELGRVDAPCLRIEDAGRVSWLCDAEQIVAYLNQRFDPACIEAARAA
jgi:glutaredoxin